MTLLPPLGLDVSKAKFNACLVRESGKLRHSSFANSPAGFALLSAWLQKLGAGTAHACMEATGTYYEALATYLREEGHTISVINPAAVKAYAQSRLSRTKNDRVDATLIAGFCAERRPPAWQPPAPELRELQALVRRLDSLVEMRTMEENRLASGVTVAAVRASLEESLAHLTQQIEKTEALIRSSIDRHPRLQRQRELLDSIPGIGETTAAALLAEVPDIKQYKSARQVAAFAGLVPRERQSGSSVRGRVKLSKIGNSRLRKALYFPAITALRCSPFFQQWAEGLRRRGKSKMAVIGAAMRKLVHLAYGVLKTGKPFDPEWTQKQKTA
jgi:transposase